LESLGIERIASYLPTPRQVNNPALWDMDQDFLNNTIGIQQVARKAETETATSLCLQAFRQLQQDLPILNTKDVGLLVVITQNPDTNMPHTSAILHAELDLPISCICFDVSLGCTGFVHGLSIMKSFMKEHGIHKGLLFNVEVMSKIVNPKDRATAPIFGDGATVTLISKNPIFNLEDFSYGTVGAKHPALRCEDGVLIMEGQNVYEFVARNVPRDIKTLLAKNKLEFADIDRFVFHQGSKRTVEKIVQTLQLDPAKVPFDISTYGNIGACSVPLILDKLQNQKQLKRILISGFGVGLAWSSAIISRADT